MKKMILLALFLFPLWISAQWKVCFNDSTVKFTIKDLECHGKNCLFRAGQDLYRSLDYGNSWEHLTLPEHHPSGTMDISFYNDTTLYWAYRSNNSNVGLIVLESKDIGSTWDTIVTPFHDFDNASFIYRFPHSNRLGIIQAGDAFSISGKIGENTVFSSFDTIPGENILRIDFLDDMNGYLLSEETFTPLYDPLICRTTDGGRTWTLPLKWYPNELLPQTMDFFFRDSSGYLVNYEGLYYTTDGGKTRDSVAKFSFTRWKIPDELHSFINFSYSDPLQIRFSKDNDGLTSGGNRKELVPSSTNCGGLISGGKFDGANSTLVLMRVTEHPQLKVEKVYEGPGFPFHKLLAMDDGSFLGVSRNGLVLKTTGCGLELPKDYPWDHLNSTSDIDAITGSILIQPNPSYGVFQIISKADKGIASWSLFNAQGKLLFKGTPSSSNQWKIDISAYPDDVYYLITRFKDGKKLWSRIVKR